MCSRAVCRRCQKLTYSGCGMHVEQVLRGVPTDQRCSCHQSAASVSAAPRTSWWSRRG